MYLINAKLCLCDTQAKLSLEVKEYTKSILTIPFNDIKSINSMNLEPPPPGLPVNKANY